ncbi:putative PMS1 protein like protein [Rhexocercosporidium sp. MPI-PUGE-AT-0058]|nr:putative PMS1 protein like protein [Rhexocercosporidium sp. MPI-PUGE-AT-0058]
MAITALPDSTIHLLGSSQVLTTPTSLVKELVDNALDAKATSVDILISPNTIDKIEVRDNGHGIPQADLDSLGRRGHTSKLRSFDELKSIGGVSLGFRGEALASAVQLGSVSVTTRTEGEAVATCVQLKAPGGIASQSRTSHPIGTKVSVTKFLYNLPVRKQTSEKESAKTLRKVKDLLQSYAFARPKVRFCLEVANGGKGSWSFTPRPHDGMKEAASQIIGRDAAAQCFERSLSFSENDTHVYASDEFVVEAFIPKPKATSAGHSQYISIDSRPVSHDKGTMRKIVSVYKYYAKGSVLEGEEKFKDPFLRLNIKCPVSSYDPNVEPAKDDVIFQNESLVLEFIEQLFKDVYGAPEAPAIMTAPQILGFKGDNFELLMSRSKNSKDLPTSGDPVNSVQNMTLIHPEQTSAPDEPPELSEGRDLLVLSDDSAEEPERSDGRKWSIDMSKDYSEDIEGFQRQNRSSQNLRHTQHPVTDIPASPGNSLNPWIISKMTAPLRPRNVAVPSSAGFIPFECLPTPHHSSDPIAADAEPFLPISIEPPRHIINRDESSALDLPAANSLCGELRRRSIDLLPSTAHSSPIGVESDNGLLPGDDSGVFRRRNDFSSARNILESPMQSFPRQGSAKKSRSVNKPFVPPERAVDSVMSQDGLRQTILTGDTIYPAQAQNGRAAIRAESEENPELAWAMDFERRKEDATRQRRKEILAARAEAQAQEDAETGTSASVTRDTVRSSPHKNRYNAAIADLESSHQAPRISNAAKPFLKTSLPDGDPRAYLMRRQKSMQPTIQGGPLRPMRAKSTRLPLESIPEAQNLHSLMLRYAVDIGAVQNALQNCTGHDMYVNHGSQYKGLPMNISEANLAESRIRAVVGRWVEMCPEQTNELEYKFENLVLVEKQ